MKTFKKVLATVLCVVMVFGSAPLAGFVGLELPSLAEIFTKKAEAASPTYWTGKCGANLNWELYTTTGKLVFSGHGAMDNIASNRIPPWVGYCQIKTVIIPAGVTKIGNRAFFDCDNIMDVYYSGNISNWCKIDFGDSYSTPMRFAKNIYFNNVLFEGDVILPDNITSIKNYTFYNFSNLTNITIPNSITSIGDYAFFGCTSLTNITIPDSVTSIGEGAFSGCKSITDIAILDSVTSMGSAVFRGCTALESVSIGNGVIYIGNNTFYYCDNLKNIKIGNGVTSIGANAFYMCKSLTSIIIPDSVTSIGDSAFGSCTSLTSVTIPESVTSIGNDAFSSCSSLNDVYYTGNISDWCKIEFSNKYSNPMCNAKNLYFSGNLIEGNINISEGVRKIGNYAFLNCSDLTSITIPNSVTSIGDYAFEGCERLTSIEIPDSVTKIGSFAFSYCSSITSITLPDNVTSIGKNAFRHCYGLTSVEIPEGVKCIENYLFDNCTNLESVTIPESVTKIYYYAFEDCNALQNIYYAGCQKNWEKITIDKSYEGFAIGPNNFNNTAKHFMYYYTNWYINGELLKEDRLKVGESIPVPVDPEVVGYTFIGWDNEVPSVMPETDLSFNAVLEINQYTVKWNIGKEVQEDTFDYGKAITPPIPEKEGMLFLGWDNDVPSTMPAENLEFTALWSETLFEYELDESIGGMVITGAKNASGDIEIPAKIDGYKVKLIANGAFIGSDITSVTIPDNVVSINELAFAFCEKLETVNLSSNLAGVGEATFVGCKNIKEINIPADSEYLTTDEYGVIYTKDFATLIYAPTYAIGDTYAMHPSTTTVLDYSFADCDDFTLTLSDNLVIEDDSEFFNVLSVNGFVTSNSCVNYKAVDGVLYNKNVTQLIKYPVDSDREIFSIPQSVKSIADTYSFMSMSGNLMMYFVCGLPCDENTFDNLYKEPQYLTVHIDSINSLDVTSLARLTFGPSHICIGDISESDLSGLNNDLESSVTYIEKEWSDAEDDLTPGTNEYYFSKVLILGYIDLLSSFIDCENDHTRLHKYAEVVDEKTGDCTTDGYTSYNCECGYEFTDVTTAQGHDYKNTVTEPSCTEKGYTTHTCSVCGDTYIDGESGGEGHKYNSVETKVTCTTDGYTTHTCSVCGDSYIDGEIKSEGHKYEAETTKEPTCTTTGLKTFTCHCGDSYTEIIKVNGHSKSEWEYIGGKEYAKNCVVCGDKLESKIVTVNMTFNGENVNRKQVLNKSTATVSATVTDNFANNLVFASSDDSVVSIDANGNVVANDIGKATITVTINGTAISDSIEVEVLPRDFTITWNVNGKQTKQTVKEYATVTPNVDTTRPGYKFVGWDSEVPSTMPSENLSFTAKFELSFKMTLRNPSTATISYGDIIILHADMNEALPNGWTIKWTADNGNFSYSVNGETCTISPNKSGDTTFTATVYDENGNEISKDTQTMKSKAGFFDKFVAFFKKLFGATKVIPQAFKGIF